MIAIERSEIHRVPTQHVHLRVREDHLLLPLELARFPDVVRATERDEVAGRLPDSPVHRRRISPIGLADDAYSLPEPLELAGGAIRGPVVHHNDLVRRSRLAKDRLKRREDEPLDLIGRHDH